MNSPTKKRKFPGTFWVANTMEIFERMAWYGFFAVSSLYLTNPTSEGALGFTSEQRGTLQGVVTFILYMLPVLTGALADRFGYKKMFIIAYSILTPAYFLLGMFHSYIGFFLIFLLVAVGAAIFKPVVVGTVARTTTEETSSMGFGIFYMMVNIGGFLGPIVAGIVRGWAWKWVFVMSSIWIACNFIWVTLFYREPTTEARSETARTIKKVLSDMVDVLGNGRMFFGVFSIFVMLVCATNEWITWGFALVILGVWVGFNVVWEVVLRLKVPLLSKAYVIVVPLLMILYGGMGGFISRITADVLLGVWIFINVISGTLTAKGEKASWLLQPIRVGNWRFVTFLLVLSGFWTAFNQIFMTMPEYIRDFVQTKDILISLHSATSALHLNGLAARLQAAIDSGYEINPEYLINIDAGAIIAFQVLVSFVMKRFPAFTTMVIGTIVAGLGIFMAGWAYGGWFVVACIVIFAFGEMAASPKSQEYIGRIAPKDKVALFMGYYFVAIALGNLFGGILSGIGYQRIAKDMGRPDIMWWLFGIIGFATAVALMAYNKYVVPGWKKEVAAQSEA